MTQSSSIYADLKKFAGKIEGKKVSAMAELTDDIQKEDLGDCIDLDDILEIKPKNKPSVTPKSGVKSRAGGVSITGAKVKILPVTEKPTLATVLTPTPEITIDA